MGWAGAHVFSHAHKCTFTCTSLVLSKELWNTRACEPGPSLGWDRVDCVNESLICECIMVVLVVALK